MSSGKTNIRNTYGNFPGIFIALLVHSIASSTIYLRNCFPIPSFILQQTDNGNIRRTCCVLVLDRDHLCLLVHNFILIFMYFEYVSWQGKSLDFISACNTKILLIFLHFFHCLYKLCNGDFFQSLTFNIDRTIQLYVEFQEKEKKFKRIPN